MSLGKKRQHWLDADDNEVYASELRTAAAIYIAALEAALAAEVKRAQQAEARVEQLEREVDEEWVTRGMPSWRNRAKRAEAELRDLTVEHLGSGPWCEGCGRVTNQVRSSEHPGLCDVCAELERVNRIVVSQSQQLGNTRSQREHELIEALDSTQADADTQFKLRAQAEAELEALKARRCGGCKHWHGHNYCAEGVAEECDVPELPDHDFACNRWTPREAAE